MSLSHCPLKFLFDIYISIIIIHRHINIINNIVQNHIFDKHKKKTFKKNIKI